MRVDLVDLVTVPSMAVHCWFPLLDHDEQRKMPGYINLKASLGDFVTCRILHVMTIL